MISQNLKNYPVFNLIY